MLEWPLGDNEQNDQDAQAYFAAIHALYQHVSATLAVVTEYANNLTHEYPAEGLNDISKRFEGISGEYTNLTIIIDGNPFYDVIRKSKSRLNTVRRIAREAQNVAQLFEKYTGKPGSYSAVKCRLAINKLAGELTNLANYCEKI